MPSVEQKREFIPFLPPTLYTYPQPLINAFSMELVRTGQHPQDLTRLEITHANHARCLIT